MFQILSDITKEDAFSDREAVWFGVWSTGSEYEDSILGTLTDYQWDRKQMTCLIVPRFPHPADGDDSAVYLLGFSQGLTEFMVNRADSRAGTRQELENVRRFKIPGQNRGLDSLTCTLSENPWATLHTGRPPKPSLVTRRRVL